MIVDVLFYEVRRQITRLVRLNARSRLELGVLNARFCLNEAKGKVPAVVLALAAPEEIGL